MIKNRVVRALVSIIHLISMKLRILIRLPYHLKHDML